MQLIDAVFILKLNTKKYFCILRVISVSQIEVTSFLLYSSGFASQIIIKNIWNACVNYVM